MDILFTPPQTQSAQLHMWMILYSFQVDSYHCIYGCLNKSKLFPQNFKTYIQFHNIHFRNQPLPVLHQNKTYVYLSIQLVPLLKWKPQNHVTTFKLIKQYKQLLQCPITMK
jgi:hypothetical protein